MINDWTENCTFTTGTANQMTYMFYRTRDTLTSVLNILTGMYQYSKRFFFSREYRHTEWFAHWQSNPNNIGSNLAVQSGWWRQKKRRSMHRFVHRCSSLNAPQRVNLGEGASTCVLPLRNMKWDTLQLYLEYIYFIFRQPFCRWCCQCPQWGQLRLLR